ncbi:hypothetical protein [Methylobacterium radiotolerans]|uniref:hypothetical protein n=1 Tax=Methylobacterium radiotolerans TaxID=31998 RepID=UPI001FD95001|nr:hypothetical protein [Methylobacterium radiotolerans]
MRSILAAALLLPIAVPAGAQSLSATATVPSGAALEPITPIANPGQLSMDGSSTTGPCPPVPVQSGGLPPLSASSSRAGAIAARRATSR